MNDLPTALIQSLRDCAAVGVVPSASERDNVSALADGLAAGTLAIVAVPGPDEPPRVGDLVRRHIGPAGHPWGDREQIVTGTDGTWIVSGDGAALATDVRVVARAAHVRVDAGAQQGQS